MEYWYPGTQILILNLLYWWRNSDYMIYVTWQMKTQVGLTSNTSPLHSNELFCLLVVLNCYLISLSLFFMAKVWERFIPYLTSLAYLSPPMETTQSPMLSFLIPVLLKCNLYIIKFMFLICTIRGYLVSQYFLNVVCNGLFLISFGLSMAFDIVDHSLLNMTPSFTPFLIFSVLLLLAFIVVLQSLWASLPWPTLKCWAWVTSRYTCCHRGTSWIQEPPVLLYGSQSPSYIAHVYCAFIICKTHFRHIKSMLLSLNLHSIGRDKQLQPNKERGL